MATVLALRFAFVSGATGRRLAGRRSGGRPLGRTPSGKAAGLISSRGEMLAKASRAPLFVLRVKSDGPGKAVTYMEIVKTVVGTTEV